MKLAPTGLIPALVTLINTVKGSGWTVTDGYGNPEITGNVIVIGGLNGTQAQDKSHFTTDNSVTIEVIARGDSFGKKRAAEKAEDIMEVLDSDQIPALSGFKCNHLELGSYNTREALNTSDNEFAVILRYDFNITQN